MAPLDLLKKISSKLIIVFLILAGILAGWLLYQRYLKPAYELNQLLPPNYQISFELRTDRFSLPKLQLQKILKNPLLKDIYRQAEEGINSELNKLPEQSRNLLKESQHLILFWQNPESYGLLVEIPNNKLAKKFAGADFPGWQTTIIKKQILVLASNPDLLQTIIGQKLAPALPAYLSLSIAPWLTVTLENSFLNEQYQNPLLADMQKILQPLTIEATANNYQLTLDSNAFALTLSLIPNPAKNPENNTDLGPYLSNLLDNPDLAVGLSSFNDLAKQLEKNESFKNLWQKLDSYLWINQQISLSNLMKKLKFPLLFSQKGETWQILTTAENQKIIEKQLKSYLAQFAPKEAPKKLPDGTRAIELIADESKIKWLEEKSVDSPSEAGWQTFTYQLPKNNDKLGFALKNGLLMAGNQINQLKLNKSSTFTKHQFSGAEYSVKVLDKLELNCSFAQVQEKPIKTPIANFFTIKPTASWLRLAENLQNFSQITAISSPDGKIKVCLEL